MTKPLVSVNLTTYNRTNLLQRALDSILAQSYPNFEIIIVDDYSEDNTMGVVNNYMDNDDRIKYFRHEENQGLSNARNTALFYSLGQYIVFMDDDDEWIDNDKILKQVDILNNNSDIGIVCSNIRYYKDKTEYEDSDIKKPKDLQAHILKGNGIIHTSTVMARKELVEKVGGFDESMLRGVDSELYRRCIVKYNVNVHFMPDVTTAYRGFGEDRMTRNNNWEDANKSLKLNLYLFNKYKYDFLRYPNALMNRIKKIFKRYIVVIAIYLKKRT